MASRRELFRRRIVPYDIGTLLVVEQIVLGKPPQGVGIRWHFFLSKHVSTIAADGAVQPTIVLFCHIKYKVRHTYFVNISLVVKIKDD